MTLKLQGMIEEPKTSAKEAAKEEETQSVTKCHDLNSDIESAGYLTPEEIVAVSADEVE